MNVYRVRWQCLALVLVVLLYVLVTFLPSTPSCPTAKPEPAPCEHQEAMRQDHAQTSAPEAPLPPAPVVKSYFEIEDLTPEEILDPEFAPNTVFYVWCGRRWFEFHHYLSVLSVMKHIRPDNLIFFHDQEPVVDNWIYNTWLQELRDEYPFLRMRKFYKGEDGCAGQQNPSDEFIDYRLKMHGGMYVNEYTIFTHFPIESRYASVFEGVNENQDRMFEMRQQGRERNHKMMGTDRQYRRVHCPHIPHYNAMESYSSALCVVTKKVFFPKDIWELDNRFGRLARTIFYNSPEVPVPLSSSDTLIPNIAHLVWLGGGRMDFLFYLSVLSLIYVAEVDVVYIHGDAPPKGQYWDSIKDNPKIKLIHRVSPKTVYGNDVHVISHVTDVWRVDFMIKYGGIYVDTDTIWTRKLDEEIRSYDAVGAYDWTYWNHPFPDTINFGVAIGKKGAPYWRQFQKSMSWFIDGDWSWNGLRQPYRIKERHPELVKIDPRLQVICFRFKCHPTWFPNYHNESIHHLNSDSITDWRNQAYSFHFTLPTPPEYKNLTALTNSNSMFAEIGQNVLKKAKLIK